jgi:hypothetical protein
MARGGGGGRRGGRGGRYTRGKHGWFTGSRSVGGSGGGARVISVTSVKTGRTALVARATGRPFREGQARRTAARVGRRLDRGNAQGILVRGRMNPRTPKTYYSRGGTPGGSLIGASRASLRMRRTGDPRGGRVGSGYLITPGV